MPADDDRAVDAEDADVRIEAAIDSIGPTEAKVTPIITGRRMPTNGRSRTHCTTRREAAGEQVGADEEGDVLAARSFSARPMMSGTATAPAYMTRTCCSPSVRRRGAGNISSTT